MLWNLDVVDGGYPKMSCFIEPISDRFTRQHILWSEWMESVRKDVECTFGVLKVRFRILKNPIQYHDEIFIEKIMQCCCVIHNMLLKFDGMSIYDWEGDVDWTHLNPDDNEEDDEVYALGGARVGRVSLVGNSPGMDYVAFENSRSPPLYADLTHVSRDPPLRFSTLIPRDHDKLQEALVVSFQVQYELGLLRWPKAFTSKQKRKLSVICPALRRARGECNRALYIQPSTLKAYSDITQTYSRDIGYGLFSRIQYDVNDVIAYFV